MTVELNFLIGLSFMIAFFILLIIFGLPANYQLINTFDFLWLGGGIVVITTGCVVLTGIPCAILEASYGFATLLTYLGVTGLISSTTTGNIDIIKAFIFTPLSIGIIYVVSKLARGGG